MEATEQDVFGETSAPYIGRWNRLVSTTNWEKGRIIRAWRDKLQADDAPPAEYSDEAWSRRVGNVSPQHVGRLRRVSERFDSVFEQYEGIFWSHFQATIDWDDAEMWLEGALQNGWSVSQMRAARWEAIGAPAHLKPSDDDIITGELDEDVDPGLDSADSDVVASTIGAVQNPDTENDQAADYEADEDEVATGSADGDDTTVQSSVSSQTAAEEAALPVRPFENLASLPDDLAEALESFKLAIIRHRLDSWSDVSPDDVLASLDALKTLVLAPAE